MDFDVFAWETQVMDVVSGPQSVLVLREKEVEARNLAGKMEWHLGAVSLL